MKHLINIIKSSIVFMLSSSNYTKVFCLKINENLLIFFFYLVCDLICDKISFIHLLDVGWLLLLLFGWVLLFQLVYMGWFGARWHISTLKCNNKQHWPKKTMTASLYTTLHTFDIYKCSLRVERYRYKRIYISDKQMYFME